MRLRIPHDNFGGIIAALGKISMARTLKIWIKDAVQRFEKAALFFGHGTDNSRDEAIYLILHTLELPLDTNVDKSDLTLSAEQDALLEEIITKRIKTRLPAAYLTHEAFFMGLPFYVDHRVLIPRSPLAETIHCKFNPWISENNIKTVLDLCTGSGCIAIATAFTLPDVKVVASDISPEALAVAKINVQKHHAETQVQLIQSDLFDKIPLQAFDIIISNPPYVDREDMENLPQEYRHEPSLGLAGGEDGLVIVKTILKKAADYLSDHGILIVEVGNSAEALMRQFPKTPFMWLTFERGEAEVFMLTKPDLLLLKAQTHD
jgi:ribosomal protein L3 glutamine methyltransferase